MNRQIQLLVVLFSIILPANLMAQAAAPDKGAAEKPRKNIAVMTLKPSTGVTEGEAEIISDRLRAELFNTGEVNIMEREQMQAVLKEQGFQQSGACTDQACVVEMGKLLGVQQIYTGSIGKVGSIFMLNMRVIDIQTAQIIKAVSRDINGMEVVVSRLPDISRELVGGEAPAKEPPVASRPAPAPAPQPAPAPAAQAAPPQPGPVLSAATVASQEEQQNKNRFGIRLGFNMFIGETWWYTDTVTKTDFDSSFNDQFDTILSRPVMVPNMHLAIPLGPALALDIGGGLAFWSQHYAFSSASYGGGSNFYIDFSNSYWYLDGAFGLAKRWYPVKLNIGVTAGYAFFSTTNKVYPQGSGSSLDGNSMDFLEKKAHNFTMGGRFGIEFMAGSHIGFNFDFIYRFLAFKFKTSFDPSGYDAINIKINPPPFGAGAGLNIYF